MASVNALATTRKREQESPRAFWVGHPVESGQRAGEHPLSSALGWELSGPMLSGLAFH